MNEFFQMGGYAGYVWPAYALAVLVLAGLLTASLRAARAGEQELQAAQLLRPARMRKAAARAEASEAP